MNDFTIRPATEADVPALLALIRELAEYERLTAQVVATESGLRECLFGEGRVADAVLGYSEGEAVAYAVFHSTISTFAGRPGIYLEDLFVKPDYRGRGFGGAMLRHVGRIALERHCDRIVWSVLHWNEPAIRFYRSHGAEPVSPDWIVYSLTGRALENLARES